MKKLLIILHFSFFVFHSSFAQQYGWVNLSANIPDHDSIFNTLRDVRFIGQEGWIAASLNEAIIYHTSDGGATFTTQSVPANSGVGISIFMRSLQEGYLVTNAGYILHTTDAGNSWITIGSGIGLLYSISFPPVPEPSGYACSGNGSVYKITGSIVTQDFHVTGAAFYSIVFPVNSDEGWVIGGTVMRHRNSTGWHADQSYDNGNSYRAIHFFDNQCGWAVGGPHGYPQEGTIIRTSNGQNWVPQTDPDNNLLMDVYFLNTLEGWAVGQDVILHTTNGGLIWTKEAENLSDSTLFTSVFAVNSHEVYITGQKQLGVGIQKAVFLKYTLITGTEQNQKQANSILYQNQPNPFRESTIISWQIPSCSHVVLKVFDFMGKKIRTLVNENQAPGEHRLTFNAEGLPAGVYFYQLKVNRAVKTEKMLLY